MLDVSGAVIFVSRWLIFNLSLLSTCTSSCCNVVSSTMCVTRSDFLSFVHPIICFWAWAAFELLLVTPCFPCFWIRFLGSVARSSSVVMRSDAAIVHITSHVVWAVAFVTNHICLASILSSWAGSFQAWVACELPRCAPLFHSYLLDNDMWSKSGWLVRTQSAQLSWQGGWFGILLERRAHDDSKCITHLCNKWTIFVFA